MSLESIDIHPQNSHFKVLNARDAATSTKAAANRLTLSYGLGVAIGTALTIKVKL